MLTVLGIIAVLVGLIFLAVIGIRILFVIALIWSFLSNFDSGDGTPALDEYETEDDDDAA